MIYTLESFKNYYSKNNRFPDGSYVSPSGYNDRQMKAKFEKYIKTLEKKKAKESLPKKIKVRKAQKPIRVKDSIPFTSSDPQWVELCAYINERDSNECCLLKLLSPSELKTYSENYGGQNRITHAHVLGRASFQKMKYNHDNVYCLNLASHSWLDQGCHPLTGKKISSEEITQWWDRILEPYNLSYEKLKEINLTIT